MKKFLKYKYKLLKLYNAKIGFLNLLSFILQRFCKPKNGILCVFVPGFLHPIYLRNVPSDIQIFTQIFLREELKIDLSAEPQVIIDGGANIGLASVYLKHRYPYATIFAVEPDEANYKMLLKNICYYKNISAYNNGIWNVKARLRVINENAGNESFIVAEVAEDYPGDNIINAITINDIVESNKITRIDLLKLDIEGSEKKVFQDNYEGWISITQNMLVEIHNWIDAEAEKTVSAAVDGRFNNSMAGEYHFYSRI